MNALTPDEILAVLKKLSVSPRNVAMICLAYKHGMRASEVCNLRLQDVDLKNEQVTIHRLKRSNVTTQPLTNIPGQPLMSDLHLLHNWLDKRQDQSDFLFTSNKGGRLSRIQVFRIFRDAAKASGLAPEKRHPHCLKHSLGYALVAENVNIAHIKQALGHRNIRSTLCYAQPTTDQTNRVVTTALANTF